METFFKNFFIDNTPGSAEILLTFLCVLIIYDIIKAVFIKIFDSFFEIRKSKKILSNSIFFQRRLDFFIEATILIDDTIKKFTLNTEYHSEIMRLTNRGNFFLNSKEVEILQKIDSLFIKYTIKKDVEYIDEILSLTKNFRDCYNT